MLYLMFHVQKKTGAGHHALQCVLTPVQEKQDAAERQLEELSKKVSQLELKRQQLQGALGDASCDSKVQCRTLFPASRAGVELTFHWKKKTCQNAAPADCSPPALLMLYHVRRICCITVHSRIPVSSGFSYANNLAE